MIAGASNSERVAIAEFGAGGCGRQAVFFAADVGFNAPVATVEAVDRDAAIRVFRAAEALGGRRVILISAYGTEIGGPEGYNTGCWKHYYAAKHAAE